MQTIERTNSENKDFIQLVELLDHELSVIDGADHSFYAKYNKIDLIRHALVFYVAGKPVACGAMKEIRPDAMEIKRMFTHPDSRKKGIASRIVTELEKWATELGYQYCLLETGKRQPDAIALYKKCGYRVIPNYGQYVGVENSVCFEKPLD